MAGPLYQGAIELHFVNKATGWCTIAIGGTLLAAEQTWQVVERY